MSAGDLRATLVEAVARHRAGDLHAALQLYRRAADSSVDPTPSRLLALLLSDGGDHRSALSWIQRSLLLDPESAASHAAHGRVLARQDRLGEAITAYEVALRKAPTMVVAQIGLGGALLASAQPAPACACFDAALRLRPQDMTAKRGFGAALIACGSLERCRQAVQVHPEVGEIRHAFGQLLFGQRRWDEAAAVLAEAAALLADDAAVRHDWGTALQEAGHPAAAIRVLAEAVCLDPRRAMSWHNLASSRQACGDLHGAMADYGRAYSLDPDSFPRIAQELAAGNPGRVWLRADDLRRSLEIAAASDRSATAQLVAQTGAPGEKDGEGD